jgi:Na+/proline symporter
VRLTILITGLIILALGFWATSLLPKREAMAYLQGTLTLGGGLLICAAFTLRMHWHGIIGAGVLALLGMVRGLGNIPKFFPPQSPNANAYLELAITSLSAALFARVIHTLLQEKSRQAKALNDS